MKQKATGILSIILNVALIKENIYKTFKPVLLIVELHSFLKESELLLVLRVRWFVLLFAQKRALFRLFEADLKRLNAKNIQMRVIGYLVRTGPNPFAEEHLSEILHRRLLLTSDAKVKAKNCSFITLHNKNLKNLHE